MRRSLINLLLLALFIPSLCMAVDDVEHFPNQQTADRYHSLLVRLRCPKCQNQNLADSNSMIAADLRKEVRHLLLDGKTDREIEDFLVARYGEFVLYKPRLNKKTEVLWYLPLGIVIAGLLVVITLVVRQRGGKPDIELASDEQARLHELLKDSDEERR